MLFQAHAALDKNARRLRRRAFLHSRASPVPDPHRIRQSREKPMRCTGMKRFLSLAAALLLAAAWPGTVCAEGEPTAAFKDRLRGRILEILDSWPAMDQYAVMFFIYPDPLCEYAGFHNMPEFTMLYKCESDIGVLDHNPLFSASGEDEERWNPAFWDFDLQQPVICYDAGNAMADALIDWYSAIGVEQVGYEDPNLMFDSRNRYIGKGPNGLAELLQLTAEIAAEIQRSGRIEAKFGRRIPILLADFEFTGYMLQATLRANPNGEADAYIQACLRQNWVSEEQLW